MQRVLHWLFRFISPRIFPRIHLCTAPASLHGHKSFAFNRERSLKMGTFPLEIAYTLAYLLIRSLLNLLQPN